MTHWARVIGRGFYTPSGRPALDEAAPEPQPASLGLLPRTLRRGLSGLTRSVLAAAEQALVGVPPQAPVPAVFASRYGEIQTAVELMRRAELSDESSPARFRHSVQNTCLGLLSLARADRAANTALSAGDQTLAMALLEAFMQLASGAPLVLVALAEEPVPAELGEKPLGAGGAVAWLLAAPGADIVHPHGPFLSRPARGAVEPRDCTPQPLALAFAMHRRLEAQQWGELELGGPSGRTWVSQLAPEPRNEASP